jgi:hypothetical protein
MYIANGKTFSTFKKAEEYAASIGMRVSKTSAGMRISNTEYRGGIVYLELNSEEEWLRYEKEAKEFEERMRAREPKDKDSREYREWRMAYSCDAPNKPGYYRANND